MIQSALLKAQLSAVETGANDFGNHTFSPTMIAELLLRDGTGENQADQLWMDQRTVGSGANDDIDLRGVLLDAFGGVLTMAEMVALFVINAPITGAANTTNLTIGGATNPFVGFLGGTTPTIGPIRPGGFLFLGSPHAAGIGTVVATTGEFLRVANSAGASATYQIGIVARSA